MSAGHYLDLEGWPRRAQFEYFRDFDAPFFSICAEVPVGATLTWCREREQSFALACWFLCQRAVNAVEPFRYRMREDRVWVHDRVHVSTTTLNSDETFRFSHFSYEEAFCDFVDGARRTLEGPTTLTMDSRPEDDGTIHGSTLPWIRFTSVSHAKCSGGDDSVPKIVLGKYGQTANEITMPVSVEVHHALMDGLHVSRFFEHLSAELVNPDQILGSQERE
jgi:chloramphenicol O-acetyltransferase type A